MVTVGAGPGYNHITKDQTGISKTPDNSGNDGRYRHKNNSHFDVFLCWLRLCGGRTPKANGFEKICSYHDVPSVDDVYRFLSRFDEEQFVSFVSGVLNSLCTTRKRRIARTILIDSSAITLDLNWFKRTITKAHLATRDFDWGFSKTHGYYFGY